MSVVGLMRVRLWWVTLSVAFLYGCTPPPPPPPPPSPFSTVLTLKQVMEWVLDPAADVIWDSVKTVISESGTKEIRPENDEQWAAVRNAAATVMESANVLMIEGRAKDQKEWMARARGLAGTAENALKAAEAKDVEALFAAGGEIYESCRGCHVQYAKHLQASRAPLHVALVSNPLEWTHRLRR